MSSHRVAWMVVGWAARLLVGALFLYAAWSKLGDPLGFARRLRDIVHVSASYATVMALAVPSVEVCTAVLLLIGLWRRPVRVLIFLILVAFTALKLYALANGHDLICGCFGNGYLGRVAVGWVGVYLNLALLAALLVDGYSERRLRPAAPAPGDAQATNASPGPSGG